MKVKSFPCNGIRISSKMVLLCVSFDFIGIRKDLSVEFLE